LRPTEGNAALFAGRLAQLNSGGAPAGQCAPLPPPSRLPS